MFIYKQINIDFDNVPDIDARDFEEVSNKI